MFSEEEQFYAYTEQSEESEVSTAGKVMWKTNIISVRKKTSDIHLPFVSCNEDTQEEEKKIGKLDFFCYFFCFCIFYFTNIIF